MAVEFNISVLPHIFDHTKTLILSNNTIYQLISIAIGRTNIIGLAIPALVSITEINKTQFIALLIKI